MNLGIVNARWYVNGHSIDTLPRYARMRQMVVRSAIGRRAEACGLAVVRQGLYLLETDGSAQCYLVGAQKPVVWPSSVKACAYLRQMVVRSAIW